MSRRASFRRAQLRRFPYVVYYEILENDDILVLAVWHGRRDPDGWQERGESRSGRAAGP